MTATRDRVSPSVRASVSPDGLVLLDIQSGAVLASNHIGGRIWQLLTEHRTRAEIASGIAAEYDVGLDRAENDVASFINMLAARGLVTHESY